MTIQQRAIKCIAETLGFNPEEIKPEHELLDDLNADSLDCLEIIMALEEEFECQINDEQADKLKTVQELIDHVRSLYATETEGGAA